MSYGSRRRDWAHADNAPPSPWPNLWRVARRGPGARRLVVEIRGASSQRPRDFSRGPQRSAGGRRRPTKRLLSNVTFSQLFVPKGRPRPEGRAAVSVFPLLRPPTSFLPSFSTPPPPHVFSLKDEPPTFWRPGRGTRPAAGPAPGVEQLFVFLFTHERVHTGSRRPMRSIVGRALCSRKPQPEPPGARPGPQSQTETACRVRSLSLLPGSAGFV